MSFDAVPPLLSRYLPTHGRALDIGAGSGRDARAMAARGLPVTAVEPSEGLRAIAAAKSADIRWIEDSLPCLDALRGEAGTFDFVLCSAVLRLITPTDLRASFVTMATQLF